MSGLEDAAFGALLRTHRLAAGLTQETLAERALISIDTVSALERGFRQAPHRDTIRLLASALALGPQDRARLAAAAARPRAPKTLSAPGGESGSTAERPNNLPLSLTRLVGRERELEEIVSLAGEHRLVTLTGAGGIGKTSTVLQVGGMLLDRLPGGVWLIELAPLRDGSFIVPTIARVLGMLDASTDATLETLLAYLKGKVLLLILDNCEHVIAETATVVDALLQRCPGLQILATSREPIRVSGEHTYRLPSLGSPAIEIANGLVAADAAAYGAIELFMERARAVDHRFTLTDENASVIAEICRRLDGIALAIELAAARVRMFSLADLARRLDERFRILTGGSRTALPRQQTMWSTIDWSHDLLDERERTLLRRVSIFSGGWTTSAVQIVCADASLDEHDVVDVLILLIEKSLVVAELWADEARYRLLESTQAYALQKLYESGQHETIAQRHADWIAGLTIAFRKTYNTLPREQWQRSLEPEVDNVRAALSYASGKSDAALAVRILSLARVSNAIASKGTKIRPATESLESPYRGDDRDAES